MGAAHEGAVVWPGGDMVKEVDLDKPSSRVPSKLLDGGTGSSTCGICSIVVQTRGLLDCCNHLFCFGCITEWFTVSNLCPLCKSRSRFITPQMRYGDTGQWERFDSSSGSLSRHEGPSDEDGQPVSFPPYFIDEEAVLCLEGDGCLVRAGLLDLDAEGNAASDTSVACDLCDCWYHGGCVSFQPDQTSFICPRCRTSKQMDKAYVDAQNMSTVASTEEKPSSTMTSSPPKNQSTYGVQAMFGSASVAIEDPEEGESHVSILLRRIPDVQPVRAQASVETQPFAEDSEQEIMWSPIREPFIVPTYGSAWRPVAEPSREPESTLAKDFLPSTGEPTRKVPYFEEELWSPTRGPTVEVAHFEELWSSGRDTVKDLSCGGTRSKSNTSPSANSFRAAKPQTPVFGPHAVVPLRPEILNRSAKMESGSAIALKSVTPDQGSRGLIQISTTESVVHPMGLIKEEISIDVDRLQVAVEQLRKGKRKVLQEDERHIDVKDLPEMPRKMARKLTSKIDVLDVKASDASKELVKKATMDKVTETQTSEKIVNSLESMPRMEAPDEISLFASEEDRRIATDDVAEEHISTPQPKPLDDLVVKTEAAEGRSKEQYANPQSEVLSAPEKVNVANLEVVSEVNVMDIVRDKRGSMVRDTNDASCTSKGVRTRTIMHREPDMNDGERPSLVERIRQQMRDTAGYGAGDDLGKVEVSDDRFIAAFKAAQTRSYEKAEVKSLSSRQQTSGRLWKVLDKKHSANGARDNLIRKLYAGGGRKCWDRDWDIAFWRERDPHQRRARKEAEGEGDGSGKDSGVTNMQPDSEDADFFSRLYVADTSLFPRNEDVKLLLVAEGAGMGEPERNRTRKGVQPHSDTVSPKVGAKDNAQKSPVVHGALGNASSADKLLRGSKTVEPVPSKTLKKPLRPSSVVIEASLTANASASSGKSRGAPSAAPKAQGKDKEATSASAADLKKDKRQWALEVLARKEGKLANPASSGKTGGGGSATKDNPFPLLLQLPVEMRPLILGDSRRNKIPSAVRQVQLNRLVEQELNKANLAVVEKSSECVDAIARAVAREEELCKCSNSKGVYLNRCARALANTDYEVKVVETSSSKDPGDSEGGLEEYLRPEYDEAVRKALEDTGLMYSPTGDPANEHGGHNREDSLDTVCKVSDTTCENRLSRPVENEWIENVLEVENADLDIYGDFDFQAEDDELDGALAKINSRRLKHISAASCNFSDGKARTGSLLVILPSTSCPSDAVLESTEPEGPIRELLSKESAEEHASSPSNDGGLDASSASAVEAQGCDPPGVPSFDDAEDMYDGLELNLNPVMSSEVMAQLRAEPCAPLSPKLESRKNQENLGPLALADLEEDKKRKEGGNLSKGDAAASEIISEDDCLKFADIDRRIENIRRSKALNGDPLRSKKSKGRVYGDANRTNGTSVQMQVEIYVNQHLKPLYRSQVITAEQFKWTVSKTAAKVMEHHGNAVSADFLITEGSKVKKLADQYLQAFAHRKA